MGRTGGGRSSYIILLVLVGAAQRDCTSNRNLADKGFTGAIWLVAQGGTMSIGIVCSISFCNMGICSGSCIQSGATDFI